MVSKAFAMSRYTVIGILFASSNSYNLLQSKSNWVMVEWFFLKPCCSGEKIKRENFRQFNGKFPHRFFLYKEVCVTFFNVVSSLTTKDSTLSIILIILNQKLGKSINIKHLWRLYDIEKKIIYAYQKLEGFFALPTWRSSSQRNLNFYKKSWKSLWLKLAQNNELKACSFTETCGHPFKTLILLFNQQLTFKLIPCFFQFQVDLTSCSFLFHFLGTILY